MRATHGLMALGVAVAGGLALAWANGADVSDRTAADSTIPDVEATEGVAPNNPASTEVGGVDLSGTEADRLDSIQTALVQLIPDADLGVRLCLDGECAATAEMDPTAWGYDQGDWGQAVHEQLPPGLHLATFDDVFIAYTGPQGSAETGMSPVVRAAYTTDRKERILRGEGLDLQPGEWVKNVEVILSDAPPEVTP